MANEAQQGLTSAVCSACGCLCDDIRLSVAGERIAAAKNACPVGERWYREHGSHEDFAAHIKGAPATLDAVLARAAEILREAEYSLVYGLTETTCEAQARAVGVARKLRAAIDLNLPDGMRACIRAFQAVGGVSCSLGEVANRADLVVFWGCDPGQSHPRHLERYSGKGAGHFTGQRAIISIGSEPIAAADRHFRLAVEEQLPALLLLRARVCGAALERAIPEMDDLLKILTASQFGVIFFGESLGAVGGEAAPEALFELVVELNKGATGGLSAHAHIAALPLGEKGNAAGAVNVMCSLTGYPFQVGFHRGMAQHGPQFLAAGMLERGEPDAALLIGEELPHLPQKARSHLARIPRVVVAHDAGEAWKNADVGILTATPGISAAGTFHRVDGVPLPVRSRLGSPRPTDEDVLAQLERLLEA
jgi:formylmethanofuran dehydrogenase subunit B